MAPFAVDIERFQKDTVRGPKIEVLDLSKPAGQSGGVPIMHIPHVEFPKVVYKHPSEPYERVEHRNAMHEIVDIELVPTQHLTKSVGTSQELEEALAEGWVGEPYIMKAPPDKRAALYDAKKAKK